MWSKPASYSSCCRKSLQERFVICRITFFLSVCLLLSVWSVQFVLEEDTFWSKTIVHLVSCLIVYRLSVSTFSKFFSVLSVSPAVIYFFFTEPASYNDSCITSLLKERIVFYHKASHLQQVSWVEFTGREIRHTANYQQMLQEEVTRGESFKLSTNQPIISSCCRKRLLGQRLAECHRTS